MNKDVGIVTQAHVAVIQAQAVRVAVQAMIQAAFPRRVVSVLNTI